MIKYTVFKQGRVKCDYLAKTISHGDQNELSRISDAVKLALSLLRVVPGKQDGGNSSAVHMSVCGHCLGNIRGQCCASCRQIENMARKKMSSVKQHGSLPLLADDLFLTAGVIFGFMKVHHGWSTYSWSEDILKNIDSGKLQNLYDELKSTFKGKLHGFELTQLLKNSMISIGDNVYVWSPNLIAKIFKDRLSIIIHSDDTKNLSLHEVFPDTPAQCSTEHDIDMYFSDEPVDISFSSLFDNNTIENIDADETCPSPQQLNGEDDKYDQDNKCREHVAIIAARMELEDLRKERAALRDALDAEIAAAKARIRSEDERALIAAEKADAVIMVNYNAFKPQMVFKHMQRGKNFRNFIKKVILLRGPSLPEKNKFKDPFHRKFLHDYLQIDYDFKFDTSKYTPKQMVSQLLYTDQFLNFVKSIVPKNINSLDKAFHFINKNLLISYKKYLKLIKIE